jgi:y4mF family transcriptional regulator
MKNNATPFSRFFKEMRKKTGLTQQQLADKSGVGLRFIRDVEQGKRTIRLDSLNTVLSLFGYCAGPIRSEERDILNEKG